LATTLHAASAPRIAAPRPSTCGSFAKLVRSEYLEVDLQI